MARTFGDLILEPSSTLGTVAYQLQGAAPGYRAFKDAYVTGDKPYYVVRNKPDTKYEVNVGGVFTDAVPDTLTRNVTLSSNGNAPVVWQPDDLPLSIYCPRSAESDEGLITGWLATARHALLRFGGWFKQNTPSANIHQLNIFDGTQDLPFLNVDTANHALLFGGDFCAVYTGADIAIAQAGQVLVPATILSGNSGSWYVPGTGRFTPPAGKYYISGSIIQYNAAAAFTGGLAVRKNGTAVFSKAPNTTAAATTAVSAVEVIVTANGTDYFDLFASASVTTSVGRQISFTAFRIF